MLMTIMEALKAFAVGTESITRRMVLFPICHQNEKMKHHKQIIERLKLQKEFLFHLRDALQEEITKELTLGKRPTRECQTWLKRVEEVEHQVNHILEYELKSSILDVSLHMKQRELLRNMLREGEKYLKKSPYDRGLIVDSPNEVAGRMATQRIESKAQGPLKETQRIKLWRKETTATPKVKTTRSKATPEVDHTARSRAALEVETPSAKEKQLINLRMSKAQTKSKPKVETARMESLQRSEAPTKVKTARLDDTPEVSGLGIEDVHRRETQQIKTLQRKEAQANVVTGVEDKITPVAAELVEVESKMTAASETKSFLIPDFSPASSTAKKAKADREMAPLLRTEILPTDEPATQFLHSLSGSIPEIIEETDQMKTEPSIEPTLPAVVTESGPSNEAMVEPQRVPSFREKDDNLPTNGIRTPGEAKGGPVFQETRLNAKRSTQLTVQMILGCITDGKAKSIGIYGIGGIGKTTALKALMNDPKANCTFDVIIWVSVSRIWSVRKIQNQIVKKVKVTMEDYEEDSEIAKKLSQALENKKFLLLLDDVWEKINLVEVGVPSFKVEDGCRVILATRSEKICNAMVAREIKVKALSSEEAWELFHEQVDQSIDYANFQHYARAIVDQCSGLPLLIIIIGKALAKENDVQAWKHALNELLLAQKDIIKQLKFSYDRLKAPELQSCFLYCSLFPEDHEVGQSELVEYWIQEGLIAGKLVDARKKGYDIVKVLTEAALLESVKEGLHIKMHDAIRDLASMILSPEAERCQFLLRADSRLTLPPNLQSSSSSKPLDESSERYKFLLRAGARLKEPPTLKEWEQANMIFLMDNEFSSLPERPNCSELSSLFLQRNHRLRVIPASFFERMSSLRVLNLSKTRINSLPKSLSYLTSLQVLILRNCERLVRLPPEVRFLRQLEVLDLHSTEIYQLPEETGELTCLRNLEVSFYGSFDHKEYSELPPVLIPNGMISRLSALTNLSIVVYPGDQRWNKIADSVIADIRGLRNLTALCLYFPEVRLLQLFLETSPWKDNNFKKFNFVVGHDVKRIISRVPRNVEFEYNQRGQCLRFVNEKVIPKAVVEILTRTTAFYLDHHFNIRSLSEFGVRNITGLEFCVVRACPKIATIIDSITLTLPFLEHLSIHYLRNLRRIWRGFMPSGSFASLKYLSVHTCPRLTFVVTSSMSKCISNLEELIVEDCQAIIEIISEDTIVKPDDVLLPRLKNLTLHHLPQLVSIWKGSWPTLEHISFYNCPCLKNHHMGFNLKNAIEDV